ncbi:MAG TPA: hypothetical protein VKX31_01735 [Brumimicrobium sp.]|nr:hypothetical protein [Brumimicrobium sp.]
MTEEKKPKKSEDKDNLQSYLKRAGKKTPPFFKKLRLAGLIIGAVGATVLAAPIALPGVVVAIAGYVATTGAVITAVSQAAIEDGEVLTEEDGSE